MTTPEGSSLGGAGSACSASAASSPPVPGSEPPVPNRPRTRPPGQHAIVDQERRRQLGASFIEATGLDEAREYDAVRPRYPDAAVEGMLASGGQDRAGRVGRAGRVDRARSAPGHPRLRVVELGAGTGLLTRSMLERGLEVHAVEPSPAFAQVLADRAEELGLTSGGGLLSVYRATAEEAELVDELGENSVDVVVAAQAWHWFDSDTVQGSIHRLLKPAGSLGILANYLDTRVDWVHRLTRIMRAGDVYRPGWVPPVNGELFGPAVTHEFGWSREITPEEIKRLATTLSSWLSAAEKDRTRRRRNLDWYLDEHLGFAPGEPVELPYITVLHRYPRAGV